ncbi:MAG: hypothetical protein M3R02_01295 [Chloroflexota bacterium]|nr:hypothetical protein [Chloroflexota bacterium]
MADPIPGAFGSFGLLDELLAERAGGCDPARLAALEAENARLRTEVAELKRTQAALIATVTNPSLKAEAATIVRLAVEVEHQRRGGQVGPDGFVRVSTARIGDDWPPAEDGDPPPVAPIRGRATVNRHLQNLAEFGLINHDQRSGTATPKQLGREVPIKETWVHLTGNSLADILQPFAHFRREQPSNHGGKRRRKELPTECPSCGSEDLIAVCRDCGAVAEEPPPPPAPSPSFHLESPKTVQQSPDPPPSVARPPLFQDETTRRKPDPAGVLATAAVRVPRPKPTPERWAEGIALVSPVLPEFRPVPVGDGKEELLL